MIIININWETLAFVGLIVVFTGLFFLGHRVMHAGSDIWSAKEWPNVGPTLLDRTVGGFVYLSGGVMMLLPTLLLGAGLTRIN